VQHGHKQRLGDLFEDMFTQPDKQDEPEPAAKKCKVSTSTPILTEIKQFCDSRIAADTNESRVQSQSVSHVFRQRTVYASF